MLHPQIIQFFSPFLLGIIKPHIYMPSGLEKSKHEYVLAHERMHIKRRDSLWKILAFGEVGVKERVKRVLCYKKSKPMVICAALILCGGILLCVGTKHNANTPSGNQEKSVATSSKGKNNLPDNEFYGKVPTIDLNASSGADGARLYYADEEKIIFGGYFGLFVYDTKNHTYIQSVDLESIGYSMTQGDAACEIQANKDGSLVYLQKMNDKEHMLIYHVDDNRFEQVTSDYKKDFLFDGFRVDEDYVSTTEVTFRDNTGTGNECWLVNGGDGSILGSLGYKYLNDQLVYPLFTQERFKGAEYFKSKDIKNIVKAEMNFQGKHYVCTEEKILEKLEKGFSKGKKLDGRSGCPFDDVMYLTREDGVVGMVLPATDSCRACYLSDGYYDLNDSLTISVRELIEKGKFYVDESVDPEDNNEQEKIILSTVESSMPDIIYQEIIQKGICKKIYNDRDETTTFRLENDSENPTLCLDFSFDKEGNLIQYVNKEYGFTEDMNKKEVAAGEGAYEKVSSFANSLEKQELNEERGLKKVKSPTRWNDKRYECYQDKKGILYVWDQEYGMIVFAEPTKDLDEIIYADDDYEITQKELKFNSKEEHDKYIKEKKALNN